jgi:hypothetical protein
MMSHTTTPSAPAPALACSGCGATYGDAAWRSLAVSARIEAAEVRRLVSPWPDGMVIEVRHCGGCGRAIAAKRRGEAT